MGKSLSNIGKKGNLFDFVEVGTVFLVAIVLAFVVYTLLNGFSAGIGSVDTPTNFSTVVDNANTKIVTSIDWGMLAFLVTALIFSVITARKIPTESLYIGIVLFMSFAFFIISFIVSNVFGGLMDNITISNFVNLQMPITKILLQYFPYVTAIYLGIVLIVFFSKNEAGI